jgi:hypothetical protein
MVELLASDKATISPAYILQALRISALTAMRRIERDASKESSVDITVNCRDDSGDMKAHKSSDSTAAVVHSCSLLAPRRKQWWSKPLIRSRFPDPDPGLVPGDSSDQGSKGWLRECYGTPIVGSLELCPSSSRSECFAFLTLSN